MLVGHPGGWRQALRHQCASAVVSPSSSHDIQLPAALLHHTVGQRCATGAELEGEVSKHGVNANPYHAC